MPRRSWTTPDVVVSAILVAVAVLSVAWHVHGYTRLSPVDELQHIDYLYRAPSAPAPADHVGQEAMRAQACRGIDAAGFGIGPCLPLGSYQADAYQEKGYQTAAAYTPIYYTATRGVAEVIRFTTPVDDLVTAGRLTGGLWLALGLVLTYAAGRRRGVGAMSMASATVLLAASPAVLYPSSTIAPDGLGLASGSLVLWCLTSWEHRPAWRRGALLAVVATVAALVKTTNLLVVAAVTLYLLMRWWTARRAGSASRPHLITSLVTAAAAVVANGAWGAVVSTRRQIEVADLPDMATRFVTDSFPWNGLLESGLTLIQPLSSPWVVVGSPQVTLVTTTIVTGLLLAGLLAAAVFEAAPLREVQLARALVLAAVVGSCGLVVLGYLASGIYFALPARYGMSMVGPMTVVAAACARSRTSAAVLAAVAAASLLASMVRLWGLS